MKRNIHIDLLKTLAAFGVIVIHTAAAPLSGVVGTPRWFAALIPAVLFRGSVPVFLMCSGALLLSSERELPLRRLYGHYIPRLLLLWLVWHIIYIKTGTTGHLYYFGILLLFYAGCPILRILTCHASREQLYYVLGFWLILGILYPMVLQYPPVSGIGGIPRQWAVNMAYAAWGYALLGYTLEQYPLKPGVSIALFVFGFSLTIALTAALSLQTGKLCTSFLEGMSVGPALMAAGIWGICGWLRPNATAITALSKAAFCSYSVHVFFLRLIPPIPSVLLLAVINEICCLAAYGILSRVPLVRRLVIW